MSLATFKILVVGWPGEVTLDLVTKPCVGCRVQLEPFLVTANLATGYLKLEVSPTATT